MPNFRLVSPSGERSPSFGRTERDTFVAVYTLQAHPLPPCLRHEVSCDFLARLCSAVEDVTQTFKLNTFKRGVSLLHAQHRRDICAPVMLSPFVHDEGGIAGREAAPLPAAAAREVVMRM